MVYFILQVVHFYLYKYKGNKKNLTLYLIAA